MGEKILSVDSTITNQQCSGLWIEHKINGIAALHRRTCIINCCQLVMLRCKNNEMFVVTALHLKTEEKINLN